MKNVIILKKVRKKKELLKVIANITATAEVAQVSNLVDFAGRYKWAISNADLDEANEL